jgi:hypothetical protein
MTLGRLSLSIAASLGAIVTAHLAFGKRHVGATVDTNVVGLFVNVKL